jgi:hypothetical protein
MSCVGRASIDLARGRRVGGFDSRGIRWYCEADGLAKEREPAGVNSEVDCYFIFFIKSVGSVFCRPFLFCI